VQDAQADPLSSRSDVQAAMYTHVAHVPPHGPFAYLSAGTLSQALRRGEPVAGADVPRTDAAATDGVDTGPPPQLEGATAQRCLDSFHAHWSVDHLRLWPTFYAAASVRPQDVAALPRKPGS
jgi:hypothetical protein